MPTLIFEGYSDDTFGEYNFFKNDYDNCASGSPIVFQLSADGEAMNVFGQYAGEDWPDYLPGCWVIGVQQVEEDFPLPPWPMRFESASNGYSPRLVIEAPDNVSNNPVGREDMKQIKTSRKPDLGSLRCSTAFAMWRWFWRIDWELVNVEPTNECGAFPPMWSPYFVEEWKCKRTGKIRIVQVR